jgi:hypothetical protein
MTQERLRELLRERVADETMPDRSARAWQAARVVRRRRRLGAAAGLVAATVAVGAGIAAVDSNPPRPRQPADPAVSDATGPSDPTPATVGDATYQGVPVWWSPDQREEQDLPTVDSPLPADIELGDRPDDPMDRALAAFAHGRSATLVGPGGARQWVDLSGVQEVTKPNGYTYFPAWTGMLTSDGERLVFPQPGQTWKVYLIATGEWMTADSYSNDADAGPFTADLGFDTSAAQAYGEVRDGARSFGMGVALPVRDPAAYLSSPEFLVARGAVLAFMDRFTRGTDSRFKECCPVAGWLDDDTVVYESRQTRPLLVSWRVGTSDFGLVSRVHGGYDVASFALDASDAG